MQINNNSLSVFVAGDVTIDWNIANMAAPLSSQISSPPWQINSIASYPLLLTFQNIAISRKIVPFQLLFLALQVTT